MPGLKSGRSLHELNLAHGTQATQAPEPEPVAPASVAAAPTLEVPVDSVPRRSAPSPRRRRLSDPGTTDRSNRTAAIGILQTLISKDPVDLADLSNEIGLDVDTVADALRYALDTIKKVPADIDERRRRAQDAVRAAEESNSITTETFRCPPMLIRHVDRCVAQKQLQGGGRKPRKQDEAYWMLVEHYAHNPLDGDLDDLSH